MDKEGRKERGGLGVKHGGNIYSCGERLGNALEIISDYVRFLHVAWYGEYSWTDRIRKMDRRGQDCCQSVGICI